MICFRSRSSAICGISRSCDKTTVFVHTLETITDEGNLLEKVIPHHNVLRCEIVQQNSPPTELNYQDNDILQRQDHKLYWMSVSVQHSNREKKTQNIYIGQVGCILKDTNGTIWAMTAGFNSKSLNLGPKCVTGIQQRCDVVLFMPKLKCMESSNCVSYFALDMERTTSVKIAAVCLPSFRGMNYKCLQNPYVYSGENDIMLGRAVIILGLCFFYYVCAKG